VTEQTNAAAIKALCKAQAAMPPAKTAATGLALLREPFPPHQISKLPKPTKQQTDDVKANFKAGIRCKVCGAWHHKDVVHLDYVGHAALTDRLLDCDPAWNWEPMALTPAGTPALDANGGMWIKLTVCGLTRLGYGDAGGKTGGDAVKETIGDCLRNAAMRFGAALDLWHKGDLHGDDDTGNGGAHTPPPPDPFDPTPEEKAREEYNLHEANVDREIRKIETITSMDELKAYWSGLLKEQTAVANDERIIAAKDGRKRALGIQAADPQNERSAPPPPAGPDENGQYEVRG